MTTNNNKNNERFVNNQDLSNNTFTRFKDAVSLFLAELEVLNPDYIVPVEKKGCKLLRSFRISNEIVDKKIRYIHFFNNCNVDVCGKTIVVIDDASKFTSMLYKYRQYFEEKGAIVYTFSIVGQIKLLTAEREKYDVKAKIYRYLEEPSYQEYILQQSHYLASSGNYFDIDHLIIKVNMSSSIYDKFISSLNRLGEIEFTNDIYTPSFIEKICLFNFKLTPSENWFPEGVSQGILRKVRFVYNREKSILTVAPMSFPIWDSNKTKDLPLFKNLVFELPYQLNEDITEEGVYFNITYAFNLILLKHLIIYFSDFREFQDFEMPKRDLMAYLGERCDAVIQSAIEFLKSSYMPPTIKTQNEPVVLPFKKDVKFESINAIMVELREEYEKAVSKAKSLLDVRYFLSYEELFARYIGRASLMKWIDILCDRGVLVTRNYEENGVYYRACRSGEGDFDHTEKKSLALLPLVINACGRVDQAKPDYIRINSMYLNKVIANFVYDYPNEEYDFHSFFTKPHYFGPLAYMKDQLDNETDIPIYNADKISRYCTYDEKRKEYITVNIKLLKDKMGQFFGQNDKVPYTELASYLHFLKYVRECAGKDGFLNELAICRDEDIYYRHIYHNIIIAFQRIQVARDICLADRKERFLRDAAINVKSAKEKLKYNQKDVYSFMEDLNYDILYVEAAERILKSFVPFRQNFIDKVIPVIKKVVLIEYLLVNLMLFNITQELQYYSRFEQAVKEQDEIDDSMFDPLFEIMKDRKNWSKKQYNEYENVCNTFTNELIKMAIINFKALPNPNNRDYIQKQKRNNLIYAINKTRRYTEDNHLLSVSVLYYSFSGYKNLEDMKNTDVVLTVQEKITELIASEMNAKVIFGNTGAAEYGIVAFDSFQSTLNFAEELQTFFSLNPRLNQVAFVFGCSSRKIENGVDIDDIIRATLNDAKNCLKSASKRTQFIISLETYEQIKMNGDADMFKEVGCGSKQDERKYEYTGLLKEDSDVIKYKTNTDASYKIGIITVLSDEYKAMNAMMDNVKTAIFPGKGAGHQFAIGTIKAFGGGEHKIALAKTTGDGNNKAAIRASKLIEHFPNLEVILMVGIAGGTPVVERNCPENSEEIIEKHVRLGDIVVSDSIVQFDYIKQKIGKIDLKGENIPPSAKLTQAKGLLDALDYKPWEQYITVALQNLSDSFQRPDNSTDILFDYNGNPIPHPVDNNRNDFPYVFSGKIASSNSVLKNPKKRDQLKKEYNVYAIEMESSGVADTTWECGISYYVVRGISDYCDSHKNNKWHKYASLVAAAYARALIEKIPTD